MITVAIYGIKDIRDNACPDRQLNFTHDHNLAIYCDGRLRSYVHLERWSGYKHDNRMEKFFPKILEELIPEIGEEEVRLVLVNSFMGSSFISDDGRLRVEPGKAMEVEDMLVDANVQYYLPDMKKHPRISGYIVSHELAHVCSALPFCGKFLPNSMLVHIDGAAFRSNCSVWYYNSETIQHVHHSWNELKDVVNNFNANRLSFAITGEKRGAHLALPGKLMGYAAHGVAEPEIMAWLRQNNWFLETEANERDLLRTVNQRFGTDFDRFDNRESLFMNFAAAMQLDFEERITSFILDFQKETGAENLYYTGGGALNIKANSVLESTQVFRKLFIPPCCNDTGLSLGAAAYLEWREQGQVEIQSPFLNRFATSAIPAPDDLPLNDIANLIAAKKVIGICVGGSEVGPRALGHRSIIARPDSIPLRKRVSEEIKKREWYRPIAPVILDEVARELFGEAITQSELGRYMLGSYKVPEESREFFDGVIHQDGTIRAQIVGKEDIENAHLYQLLNILKSKHGINGLINTSFNIQGQPIIHNPDQALEAARKMGLDGVLIHDRLYQFS